MPEEIAPYRVKLLRLQSGERFPAIVDARGLLATQPNIYAMCSLRGRERAAGTGEKRLRAIALALNWASLRNIDLQARTESFELLSPAEIEDLRDALRVNLRAGKGQKARDVVRSGHYVDRCHAVRDYIVWHAEAALQRIRVGDMRLKEARLALDRFVKTMDEGLPSGRPGERDPVGEETLQRMLEVIVPGNPDNPFQPQHQHRNYALLLLYYETGMRRAEALILKGEDLVLHGEQPSVTVVRRPDDPDDTRGAEPRVKTLGRPLPITKHLAQALDFWIKQHRTDLKRYPGAKRVPYVFVSRTGKPLGLRTVNDMYDLLRARVEGLPASLTAHAKRHTANVRFSKESRKLGWTDGETELARNNHFGWVKGSKQGAHYNREHAREMSAQLVESIQRRSASAE
ncbi:site-specific integrase [Methylobacterium fujisawaense]|uniref:site-specific integrase n=1 Tax=Methylobacterium fujisawaense TaxID=107400 RepID=UPI00313F3B3F